MVDELAEVQSRRDPEAEHTPRATHSIESPAYIGKFTRTRLLTASEETALARRIKQGDGAARDRLVEANMRLVINVARSYQNARAPIEDLIQEGAIGLMTAAERFDPERGFRFSTYATPWIRQAISRALDSKFKSIRLPNHVSDILRKAERAKSAIARVQGADPTPQQVAEFLGLPARKLEALMAVGQEPLSLDMPLGEDDSTTLGCMLYDDNAADPQNILLNEEKIQILSALIETLSPREQEIVRRRLGCDGAGTHILQEIGMSMRLSRERVRQIELQALRKLKFAAQRNGISNYITG